MGKASIYKPGFLTRVPRVLNYSDIFEIDRQFSLKLPSKIYKHTSTVPVLPNRTASYFI